MGFLLANTLNSDPKRVLNLQNFIDIIPDINFIYYSGRNLDEYSMLPNPRIFSVHSLYDPTFPKVIYMVRDPRDVMVSYWHFKKVSDRNFSCSLNEFILMDDMFPSSWDKHVTDWVINKRENVLCVRFEEMVENTRDTLEDVVSFIGLEYDGITINRAIELSKFDKMKKLELEYGVHNISSDETNGKFMRKGKIGSWREELNQRSVKRLEQKYGGLMTALGYKLEYL
jgi:hypothetical protein